MPGLIILLVQISSIKRDYLHHHLESTIESNKLTIQQNYGVLVNTFFQKFVKVCPKTGRIRKITLPGGFYKLLFPIIGLAAMVWIFIRVIPKPSRLSYPCVRTAMPIASGFIGYLAMLALSTIAFFRSKKSIRYYPVFFLGSFFVCSISGFVLFENGFLYKEVVLTADASVNANEPIGIAQGMQGKEGRVVWVHNPNAVNQNCYPDSLKHAWWMAENNNQSTIDSMVSAAIDSLTVKKSDSAAWQAIFQYHNAKRGKTTLNYVSGEKIFIKINSCSGWSGNINTTDLSKVEKDFRGIKNSWYGMSETSPAIVLAVLHQLVDVVHVAQSDIYIGDPIRNIYKEWYDQWHSKYTNVHYLGYDNKTSLGREQVKSSKTALLYYSDRGTILRPNVSSTLPTSKDTTKVYRDSLYTIFEDTEYMINLPQLKGHMRAGISMFAKNHFGSHTRSSAAHLHMGLPCPIEMSRDTSRLGYGLYRVQVDLMTHSLLREKNLIFLMDALWGTDYEQDKPLKWQMAPFNNGYSASVFASFDNVAIESVGYDFLRSEFTVARGAGTFVQMRGADDYLHQAADSTTWPAGIKYDPDSTGVHIYSLGVHEHWNNAADKKYSRNLETGTGIELITVEQAKTTGFASQDRYPIEAFELYQNYPNPFNPSTTIKFNLLQTGYTTIKIYDILGKEIETLLDGKMNAGNHEVHWNAQNLSSGVYFYKLQSGSMSLTKKLIYQK
jgi:hypothetical protein